MLLKNNIVKEFYIKEVEQRVAEEVSQAALQAEQNPLPNTSNFEQKVYVSLSKHKNEIHIPPLQEGRKITYREAITETMKESLENDPDVFAIGEDIGISGGAFKVTSIEVPTKDQNKNVPKKIFISFSKHFDEIDWNEWWNKKEVPRQRRVIDAPLAEAGFCGLALGASQAGLKAIVEFQFADFASEAFKMIVNYAATQNIRNMGPIHVVFRLPAGHASHTSIYHSVNPESWFHSTPGLKIVAPTTAFDAKGLLKASLIDGNPVLYIEYKGYYNKRPETLPPELNLSVPEEDYAIPIGKARIVKEGQKLTIVTFGSQIFRVMDAVKQVENKHRASIEVIDLRTIVPYDKKCVSESIRKTNKILVTCEAPRTGCFGNTIITNIVDSDDFNYLDCKPKLIAAADTPVPFATELEKVHLPTVEKLIPAIEELLSY